MLTIIQLYQFERFIKKIGFEFTQLTIAAGNVKLTFGQTNLQSIYL